MGECSTKPSSDTCTALVNDLPEHCQTLAMTKHHCREEKQGKPFFACPTATNKTGRSRRAGEDPEPSPAPEWHRAITPEQAVLQTACPDRIPLTLCSQTPHQRESRHANKCTCVASPPSLVSLHPHGWARRQRKHPSMLAQR